MPKLKTRKGVAKRFKFTKKRKVKSHPCGRSHLLSSKKSKRLRRLRRASVIESKKNIKYIKRMLPYG
ncbi:MAG: 50S ribosomal protein L35 [Candidatus Omnitrophica bacterium CG23_combo_of_CG06-09_8_20_14_all_40_11]|nr:MAG: 50S ribosomal protein L35 [Candidatus Omnitrophica bacterium CG23_combo_of_CG06-09_8_20_14_all_40_11]